MQAASTDYYPVCHYWTAKRYSKMELSRKDPCQHADQRHDHFWWNLKEKTMFETTLHNHLAMLVGAMVVLTLFIPSLG
ncbi:hypothetical protein HCU74_13860 [Spongiibacter sp. KMU-166]|uniref:Uncharacterized protein n=1 Tax=Spongiibacter thalassae TaxID=2721624 RepID=A0ABX1GH06_9GAMM|nr:hypothetical protein [Spongiibacter thalassae]NKI18497.1 hypothetical protein [Spongiibacter thalassae]